MAPPIRVGLIGLSAAPNTWAQLAHLPYLANTKQYTITAVLNSSIASAEASIQAHKLPEGTRAHASPQDLAADPNVDLVVCSVHVNKHYETVKPSLEAGKNVFVEWPLAATTEQAEEMTRIAEEKKVKIAVVGLQGRLSRSVTKIKELVDAGRVGKILSSSFTGAAYNFGATDPKRLIKYVTDENSGGSMVNIHFAHTIDYVEEVLGPLKEIIGKAGIQRPEAQILDGESVETHSRRNPDHIQLQGTFQSGALLSYHLRGGLPFPGAPGLAWRIYGDKGEIRVTAPGPMLNLDYPETKIEVHDHATNKVEEIAMDKNEYSELPRVAQNIAVIYETIAKGDNDKITFRSAAKRHRFLDLFSKSSAENVIVTL